MKNYLILALIVLGSEHANSQWIEMSTPATYHLYSIEAVTDDIIYAGGYGGSLERTTDGGTNWEAVSIGSYDWINAIHFFNPTEGWLATSSGSSDFAHVLKTSNGGQTWTSVLNADEYSSMSWPSQLVGYVGTWSGTVEKTSDGGLNWATLSPPTTSNIPELQFLDAQNGFAVSTDYYLHRTHDGGATWESFYHAGIRSVYFHDFNNGFCVDSYGRIGKTTDGGETFTYWQSSFLNYKLQDIQFNGSSTGFVVGGLDCSNGNCITKPVILWTNDGGITWNNETNHPLVGQERGFYEIDFTPNGTTFLAGSDALVLKSEVLVGLTDLTAEQALIVSPNPNTGNFSFSLPNSAQMIRIYSVSGALVYEQRADKGEMMEVNIAAIDAGVYFLSVELANGTSISEKLLIE